MLLAAVPGGGTIPTTKQRSFPIIGPLPLQLTSPSSCDRSCLLMLLRGSLPSSTVVGLETYFSTVLDWHVLRPHDIEYPADCLRRLRRGLHGGKSICWCRCHQANIRRIPPNKLGPVTFLSVASIHTLSFVSFAICNLKHILRFTFSVSAL